ALLKVGGPGPTILDEVVPQKKLAWQASVGGPAAAQRLAKQRLAGWPKRLLVDRSELPATDREFVERVARDTWRGLAELTDRENGLPVDHVRLSPSLESPDSRVGDYTNVTTVGLHLVAVIGAYELGLVSESDATVRIAKVLDTLERLETYRGFFFNYY